MMSPTMMIVATHATMLLADLGATVVKVERSATEIEVRYSDGTTRGEYFMVKEL